MGVENLPPGGKPTNWGGVMAYDNKEPGFVGAYQVPDADENLSDYGLRAVREIEVVDPAGRASFTITRPLPSTPQGAPVSPAANREAVFHQIRNSGVLGHRLSNDDENGTPQRMVSPAALPPQQARPAPASPVWATAGGHPAAQKAAQVSPVPAPAAKPAKASVEAPRDVLTFFLAPHLPVEQQQDPIDQAYHRHEFDEAGNLLLYYDRRFSEASGMRVWFPRCPSQTPIIVQVPSAGEVYALPTLRLSVASFDVCVLQILPWPKEEAEPAPAAAPASFQDLGNPPTWPEPPNLHAYRGADETSDGILSGVQANDQASHNIAGLHDARADSIGSGAA